MDYQLQETPLTPYNVLAQRQKDSTFDDLIALLKELKEGYDEFSKTGYQDKLFDHLKIAWQVYQNGNVDYGALVKGVLSFASLAPIPGAGVAVPLINMILPMVWPDMFGGAGKNDQVMFKIIMDAVEKQIDKQLSSNITSQLNGVLDGMRNVLENFHNDLQSAICQGKTPGHFLNLANDPCQTQRDQVPVPSQLTQVKTSYTSARDNLDSALTTYFNDPTAGITNVNDKRTLILASLPLYTMGANLTLLLHHGYIQFMERWKSHFDDTIYVDFEDLKARLQEKIREYSKNVLKVFKDYLPDSNSSNKSGLNAYNQYVRSMQINCLDYVALWATLDVANYPDSVSLDQTRVVLSDFVGQNPTKDSSVNLVYMLGIPGYEYYDEHPSFAFPLFISYFRDELSSIEISRVYRDGGSTCYPTGINLNYTSGNTYSYGSSYVGSQSYRPSAPFQTINAQTFYDGRNRYDREDLYTDNADLSSCSTMYINCTCPSPSCNEGAGISCNAPLAGQKINAFYPFKMLDFGDYGSKDKLGLIASYVPYDLSPENVFGEWDEKAQKIIAKGIPAEKGFHDDSSSHTVVREWVNGANAVKLPFGPFLTIKATNLTAGNYYIRMRYANRSDHDIELWQKVFAGGQQLQSAGFKAPSTKSPDNHQMYVHGEQGNYMLKDISWPDGGKLGDPIFLPSGEITVKIAKSDSREQDDLFIDRIEFIPVETEAFSLPSPFPLQTGKKVNLWESQSRLYTVADFVEGTIAGNASITFQFYNGNKIVKTKDLVGPGLSKICMCWGPGECTCEAQASIQFQENVPEKFDKIYILMNNSDGWFGYIRGTID